jgi:hypothetical protein
VTELVFYVGQDVPLAAFPVDDTGAPANGAVTVVVTAPDSTTASTSAPVSVATGQYTAVVPTVAQAGTYLVRWTCVGAGNAFTWVDEQEFTVVAQSGLHIVDIASVRAHLNLSNTVHDDEIKGFIYAADDLARDFCGPLALEQHTQWVTGGRPAVGVDWRPIQAITSVTEYYGLSAFTITEQQLGAQTNAFGYTIDYVTSTLTRRTFGGAPALWALGANNVKIVYTAGLGKIPFTVRLGALELVRHLYQQTQQGRRGGRPSMSGADGEAVPMGFALPDRVVELWAPYRRPPGIA